MNQIIEMEVSLAAMTYNLMRVYKIRGVKWFIGVLKKAILSLNKAFYVHEAPPRIGLRPLDTISDIYVTLNGACQRGPQGV